MRPATCVQELVDAIAAGEKKFGDRDRLARHLHCSKQCVSTWMVGRGRIPLVRAMALAALVEGVSARTILVAQLDRAIADERERSTRIRIGCATKP